MKKWLIYIMMLPMLVFTACTEDFNEDVASPQRWEQEKAKSVKFAAEKAQDIDLNVVSSEKVKVCSITKPSLTEGRVKGYELYLDEKTALEVDSLGQVRTSALQDSVVALYGRRPEMRTVKGRLYALVSVGGQTLRSDSVPLTFSVKPKAPFIDKAYYLIGNMNEWKADDVSKLIKLNQSGDVYENPVFSTILKVPANCYWKVIPQKRVDAFVKGEAQNVWGEGVLGCAVDGDESVSGTLLADGNAMKIKDAGWVKIELNMLDYTYKVTLLGNVSPYLYVPGNHQGWSPETAPFVYSADFMNYSGFVSLDGEFKFTSEQTWKGTNYGAGEADGSLSTDGSAGNLKAEKGFYLLKANISTLTWSAVQIKTFGLIGSATAGGWDTSTPMTFDAAKGEYTITAALKDGELKFRANDAWDVNLGGDVNNLTFGGDNIAVTAGTYKIKLSLSNAKKYTCTMEKQ